jgi:hypothetical protein
VISVVLAFICIDPVTGRLWRYICN